MITKLIFQQNRLIFKFGSENNNKMKVKTLNQFTNHNPIWMLAIVRGHFSSNRKAFNTKIKIWAYYTLNPNLP